MLVNHRGKIHADECLSVGWTSLREVRREALRTWWPTLTEFYRDYEILNEVAQERDALAMAVGIDLDRKLSPQVYARRVEALDKKIAQARQDPDVISWPLPESIKRAVPETIVRYLGEIRATRVDHDGTEIINPGSREPAPAWGRLCKALNEDVGLWRHIESIAESMYPKKRSGKVESDHHEDVAAEAKMKVISTIRCRCHVWHSRRHDGDNWRGFIYCTLQVCKGSRRGGAIFERAFRNARGTKGAAPKGGMTLFQLDDTLDPSEVDVRRSWVDEDPAHIVARQDLIDPVQVAIRGLDDQSRQIVMWKFYDEISNSEIARNLGVSLQRTMTIINRALVTLGDRLAA